MSFLLVPGNIKQQFAPFVLNPNSALHKAVSRSPSISESARPQIFSFRPLEKKNEAGTAQLKFYPSSLDNLNIEDDISFKLLYSRENGNVPTGKSILVNDILNSIPGIQIREFLPDTRLDQCINLFTDMFKNMTRLFSKSKESADTSQGKTGNAQQVGTKNEEDGLFKKITAVAWYTMKYMVGAVKPDFYSDLALNEGNALPFSSYKTNVWDNDGTDPNTPSGRYVMTFPYTLYYNLQSCVTTNIYEVPGASADKTIMKSGGGMHGWTDGGSDFMSAGGFRLTGLLSKIPGVGNLANMILGNIGINYMPWWNAESGSKTQEPQIDIKFDLFNDSAEAAMANFIFVNTIIPNNKWIQYNMFQHSSNLYDVKIEGINRLFACAGDFEVTYDGVLRDPPDKWVKDLVNAHANLYMNAQTFMDNILTNKLIKIPDVYHVTLHFQSLLPANFNNYIFNYAENANHITRYDTKVYKSSIVADALPKAIAKYVDHVVDVWNNPSKPEAQG